MVFSPYRLFCFLLLKQAGIPTLQASFMYNETAAAWKVSIHDFFLANTMHDFLYSICSAKCEGFSSVQAYSESRCISHKTKAVQFPPYRLMFIFSNADGTATTWRFLYSNLCIESLRQCRQFQPRKPIRKTATSHAKQKRQGFHHTA